MRILSAAALLLALACGGSSDAITGPPTNASVAGKWSLVTVNGSPLPWVLATTITTKNELLSDVLTLNANGTFVQTTTTRTTVNGAATTSSASEAGKYTLKGTSATFVFDLDASYGTGTIDGNALTIAGNGNVTIYTKEK